MPALEMITIKGYKSIRSIEQLELNNINIIIGSNGSGKSNFISIFSFLNSIRLGRLQEFVKRAGGADDILHFGRETTDELFIHLDFASHINQYDIKLIANDRNELVPISETVSYWDNRKYSKPYRLLLQQDGSEAGISVGHQGPITDYVRSHLDRWRLYHFHDTSSDSPLKRSADINDNRFLRSDGSNLPAFLYMLGKLHPESYKVIISSIRDAAPFFDDFVLEPLILNEEKIQLEWREQGHDKYMPASALSDGTIRFIALATLLLQPEVFRPSLILIDEPELGLHPYALSILAGMVRYAATHSQVIISTQSALLLDQFEPEEVLVADRVNGSTTLKRLDSDVLGDWLDDYSLGQLWEKAEFGGRPR